MCICAQIWVHAHYIYISKYSPKVLTIFVFVLVLLFQTWRTISKRCYSTILCSCKLWCKLIVILSGKLLFKNVLTCPLWPYLVIPLKPSLQKRLRKNLHMDFVSNLISKQNKTKQKPLYFLSLGVCVCWGGIISDVPNKIKCICGKMKGWKMIGEMTQSLGLIV